MKAETLERVAIAFCLSGDDEGFIQELDAALKSVLHNAPRRTPLDVYVVGDRSASCAVERSLEASGLGGSAWPLPIEIRIIDVEALIPEWRGRVLAATPRIDERHTFGAFYRLFLHEILPSHVHHVIYSDVDVVFLANVSGLWPQRDPEVMVQWGESQCTGVMLLNMALMKSHFWEMASEAVDKSSCYGDQKLMGAIQDRFPHMLGHLSLPWDAHLSDGLWRLKDALPEHMPRIGYLHFNGGGRSQAYFQGDDAWVKRVRGWRLANFYLELPWPWLLYMSEVWCQEQGSDHRLSIRHENASEQANRLR